MKSKRGGDDVAVAVTAEELINSGLVPEAQREKLVRYFEARKRFDEVCREEWPLNFREAQGVVEMMGRTNAHIQDRLRRIQSVLDDIRLLTAHEPERAKRLQEVLEKCRSAVVSLDADQLRSRIEYAERVNKNVYDEIQKIRAGLNDANAMVVPRM